MNGISRKRAWGNSKAAGIQKLSPTIDVCCMASYRARRKKMRTETKAVVVAAAEALCFFSAAYE